MSMCEDELKNKVRRINGQNFIAKAAADSDISFIAYAKTPWHAISIDASIKFLRSKGLVNKGMIMVQPHPITGINLTNKNFLNNGYDVYFPPLEKNIGKIEISKLKRIKLICINRFRHIKHLMFILSGNKNKNCNKPIYVISPVFPNISVGAQITKMGRFVKFVVCDEGAGSYMSYETVKKPDWKQLFVGESGILKYYRTVFNHKIIFKFHNVISTMTFFKDNEQLIMNSPVLPFYKDVLLQHVDENENLKNKFDNAIIVCSSINENNAIQNDEEIKVWNDICECLHKHGYKLFLKPHPRDSYYSQFSKQWHCELIDDKSIAIEQICATSFPKIIIGHCSTALVNANLFYGIKSICVVNMLNNSNLSNDFVKSAKQFQYLFSNFIEFPSNIDDVLKIVKDSYVH